MNGRFYVREHNKRLKRLCGLVSEPIVNLDIYSVHMLYSKHYKLAPHICTIEHLKWSTTIRVQVL